MAFRQPTYHAPQRTYTTPEEPQTQAQQTAQQSHHLADSQEWILFSPSAASTTDRTYTASTARTRTVGRSRMSDLGSLDTAARSYDDEVSEQAVDDDDEDDGELDSLDSHLHEFRAEPSLYGQSAEASGTVLPTHDGLGSFRLDQTAMGDEVQEHLYAFERYNPRRVKRRRESVELGMLELENDRAAEAERTRRIEEWRMEQSRVLVEEIQKETRRRKQSMSTTERRALVEDREQEDVATLSNVDTTSENGIDITEEGEGLWSRITRRVIRDLMGIDDDLLSIIFGEALPADDDLSTTPPASQPLDAVRSIIPSNEYDRSSWEYRLLERVARELGLLVNQLSDHPGAFSTYLRSQQEPLPYAGLPVIQEAIREQSQPEPLTSTISSSADPQFIPTLRTATQPVSIPTTSLAPSPLDDMDATPRASNNLSKTITQEEWERELDIKMVFRYLRSRFVARFHPSPPEYSAMDFVTGAGTAHLATASTADTAARAARVRQHHPLVNRMPTKERRRSIEKRTWKATVPGGGGVSPVAIHHIRRGSSSCASERLSLNGRIKRNSGSSRHYWDFGGQSVGSGSLIASTGGMGSWGEV